MPGPEDLKDPKDPRSGRDQSRSRNDLASSPVSDRRPRTACALAAFAALESLSVLEPDILLGPTEAEIRTFIHDFVTADHDNAQYVRKHSRRHVD